MDYFAKTYYNRSFLYQKHVQLNSASMLLTTSNVEWVIIGVFGVREGIKYFQCYHLNTSVFCTKGLQYRRRILPE